MLAICLSSGFDLCEICNPAEIVACTVVDFVHLNTDLLTLTVFGLLGFNLHPSS